MAQTIDDRIVVAQIGEGIISILQRNEMNPTLYLREFIEINKEKIGKDSLLYAGNTYLLPELKTEKIKNEPVKEPNPTLIYPIFGKKYEQIFIKDKSLEGAVFYLVSGHGGPDPGAIGSYGSALLSEDEYSYDVTLRLAKNLIERSAEVYMIVIDEDDGIRNDNILFMDKDEQTFPNLIIPINQRARLKQRADAVNELYMKNISKPYQRLITIHIDSRSDGGNIDVFFYHHHRSKTGKKLANNIHQTFRSKYERHQPGRKYDGSVSSRSGLYMIKNTLPPMVYIELGNIRNDRDQRRLVLSDNRQALANWISEGILKDYSESKN